MNKFKFVLVVLFFNNILFGNIENIKTEKEVSQNEPLTVLPIEKTFEEKAQENVKKLLSSKEISLLFTNKKIIRNYYKNFDYKLFWVDQNGIKDIGLNLLETIKNDPVLKPHSNEAFKLDKIVKMLNSLEKDPNKYFESMTKIDFMLTEVYDRYMKYLSSGFINWRSFQKKLKELDKKNEILADWEKHDANKNISSLLIKAINENDLLLAFNEVNYTFPKAKELSSAINELEQIASAGGYTKLPEFKTLRIGDKSEIVKILRKRLLESKDLTQTCENVVMAENVITNNIQNQDNLAVNNEILDDKIITEEAPAVIEQKDCEVIFDDELKEAVISFQKSHGLLPDGIVGGTTRKNLNISAESKISKIRLNLERMRWLPRTLGEKFLLVNIPDYKLKMYEKGDIKLDMNVVVGEKKHPTPIFSNEVSFIVLNPYWRIPPRIVEREIIPKLITNPNYLNEKGINVHQNWDHTTQPLVSEAINWNMYNPDKVALPENIEDVEGTESPLASVKLPTLRLIQVPSDTNPLGRIKFMFPNKYAVYMHDTPAKSLFSRNNRAFSHGCIRLAQPKELLKAIASEDKNVDYDKANEVLKEIEKTTMGLKQKIPVHIVYLTSWIDENGKLQFRDDIYNYDRMQKQLLF